MGRGVSTAFSFLQSCLFVFLVGGVRLGVRLGEMKGGLGSHPVSSS